MSRSLHGLLALAAAAGLAGCAANTPAVRIDRNPELFAALPERQQQLVSRGEIERGMPPEAVFLAWGRPDRRSEGEDAGVPTMRWDYSGLRPVYATSFHGGWGWGGWGWPYGHGGYSHVGVAPSVAYVPERRARVLFRNQRVDSWERMH